MLVSFGGFALRLKYSFLNLIHDRALLCRLLLCAGWVLGIVSGCISACFVHINDSLMHMLLYSHMSIVGGLAVSFFPLVISAIIVWYSKTFLLIPLSFIKAYMFSYASGIILRTFSCAGWLACLLYMFADIVLAFFFFRLWFCCLKKDCSFHREFLLTGFCGLAVFCIDYFIIAPFVMILFR